MCGPFGYTNSKIGKTTAPMVLPAPRRTLRGREKKDPMADRDGFIRAYHDFRDSVDFSKTGILPELDNLIWCMLIGIPDVPADEEKSPQAGFKAIDQRVAILKAIFVEVNRNEGDSFLDRGLLLYDEAARTAKKLLQEGRSPDDLKGPLDRPGWAEG